MQESCINCSVKYHFICSVRTIEREYSLERCPCKTCIVKVVCNSMCISRRRYWHTAMAYQRRRRMVDE